jgi:predicted GH43/DUF377 family glycosyl hydrolase
MTPATTATERLTRNVWWLRDAHNPVLPPGPAGGFDAGCAMNPFALCDGETYRLYYAGADDEGRRRICLATAAVADAGDPARWRRHGPLFDPGAPGSFDARWCVLPHVVQLAPDRWHLYYTGNSGRGQGLSAFPGIGLAVSADGETWRRASDRPVIAPSGVPGDPDAIGVAGGSVLRARLPGGGGEWRFYYTGCPTNGDDLFRNQQKTCCLAVSADGVRWEKRGAVLRRDPDRDYENVAAAGPVVRQEADGTYRMWYSAIGTRWGYYSICYAESEDGLRWRRGARYGDNLQLAPAGTGWERQMVEYPAVLADGGAGERLRLFYCGNGYGASGIGTAVAGPLRATPAGAGSALYLTGERLPGPWQLTLPARAEIGGRALPAGPAADVRWHGPDMWGAYWHEQDAGAGLAYRIHLTPAPEGLALRLTVVNGAGQAAPGLRFDVTVEPAGAQPAGADAGAPPPALHWDLGEGDVAPPLDAPAGGAAAGLRLAPLLPGETRSLTGTLRR